LRRNFGEVLQKGRRNSELVAEMVEAPEIPLVASERLGSPQVSCVNQLHLFQHHEGVHDAAREWSEANVGTYGTELADERAADQGLGKKETTGQVMVTRPEGRPYANALGVIQHVAGWIGNFVEDGTRFGKEALEPNGKAATITTTRACRKHLECEEGKSSPSVRSRGWRGPCDDGEDRREARGHGKGETLM
jgi:hypothetical protein